MWMTSNCRVKRINWRKVLSTVKEQRGGGWIGKEGEVIFQLGRTKGVDVRERYNVTLFFRNINLRLV